MSPFEILDLLFYDFRFEKERNQSWLLDELTKINNARQGAGESKETLSLATSVVRDLQSLAEKLNEQKRFNGEHRELAAGLLALAVYLLKTEVE